MGLVYDSARGGSPPSVAGGWSRPSPRRPRRELFRSRRRCPAPAASAFSPLRRPAGDSRLRGSLGPRPGGRRATGRRSRESSPTPRLESRSSSWCRAFSCTGLSSPLGEGSGCPRLADYAKRRFLRIIPAYWAALTVLDDSGPRVHREQRRPAAIGLFFTLPVLGGPVCYGFTDCGLSQTWSLVVEVSFEVLPLYALAIRSPHRTPRAPHLEPGRDAIWPCSGSPRCYSCSSCPGTRTFPFDQQHGGRLVVLVQPGDGARDRFGRAGRQGGEALVDQGC